MTGTSCMALPRSMGLPVAETQHTNNKPSDDFCSLATVLALLNSPSRMIVPHRLYGLLFAHHRHRHHHSLSRRINNITTTTTTTIRSSGRLTCFYYILCSTFISASHPFSMTSQSSSSNNNNANNNTPSGDPLRPVVFCGPSGVGKGTLINLLMERFPNDQFGFSVSHTTRPPRPGEQDGVHYHFTTVPKIQQEIKENKFIEYAEVHGKYYGTRYVYCSCCCYCCDPHMRPHAGNCIWLESSLTHTHKMILFVQY